MAERALNDETNLQYKRRDPSTDTNDASSPTNNSNGSAPKGTGERSVRPKEKLSGVKDKKDRSPRKTHHTERTIPPGRFGKWQHGKPPHGQGGQTRRIGSGAGRGRHNSRTQDTTGSRRRAIEVESCAPQRQRDIATSHLSQSSSNRSFPTGSRDKRIFQPISSNFLKGLLQMEPSEAAIQLGSLKGSFATGLEEPTMDDRRQRLLWDVLAHISDNDGAASTAIMLLTVVVSSTFFSTHLRLRLINLRAIARQRSAHECVSLIAVLITVFEAMLSCIPSRAAEIKVPLVLMVDVVNLLEEELAKDVKPSLVALMQFIESLEEEKELTRQKQRNTSSKPPPDDFRKQSILPTYQELTSSYLPYLRPHIVKGAYPNADHYLDVQFRLMKEDYIQPLRSGLAEYLRNKQVRPENRVKVQDIRIYENVRLKRPMTDRSGVSYQMSFRRIPNVNWEISKRLIYGSLVLLSDDDFKTYIPATVANRKAGQLANGLVEIRPIDEGMSSMVDKTFVMVESTVFFEAYRHVLVGLQRVSSEAFPMARHILDLDPDIKPPTYLLKQSHPKLDVSNLRTDRKSKTKVPEIPQTQLEMTTSLLLSRNEHSQSNTIRYKRAINTSFPVSVLDGDAWPVAGQTDLNPSQLEAVKGALTQELSLIQGPPGTGKTYIGLKIVETLLRNMNCWSDEETGPILLVCYTNHALDQFLLGIMQFHDTGIIRVGGRSKCEELEPHNLKKVIRENRYKRDKNSQYIRRRAGNIRHETEVAKRALEREQLRMQLSTEGILIETEFNRFHIMSDEHFKSVTRMRNIGHADSWMIEWLIPDDVSVKNFGPNLEKEYGCDGKDRETIRNDTHEGDTTTQSIDVENERELIEAQRVFDDDLEEDDLEEEKDFEKNDSPLAVYFRDLLSSKDISRRVKNFLEEKISMQKRMQVNHVSTVRDVWRLNIHQRWALYYYWLSEYISMLESKVPLLQNEYIQLCAELQETNDHEKCLVLQQATIVGMTTTRAANEREVLHRVKPKIIIVEEAAEVLESHIITSLHTSCEQLILIGDHQQLRPKPNVYKLATRFHLDVSMFERLVKNGFPYKKLQQQHRMRPEISSLMRDHFYPELEDHNSVSSYEDVKGVEKNVFFLDHIKEEAHVRETMSHYNLHEVDFTVALCRYFLNQDYKPHQITILTAYTGQLLKFKERMDRATFEGVTVKSVDNYQGEENDIILLSFVRSSQNGKIGFLNIANRVCVSLSRAKKGLYCIGNFTLYSEKCSLWKGIFDDLKASSRVGKMMMLQCYNHPHNKTEVALAADFEKVPNGGCGIPCDTLLDCGHVCIKKCHPKDRLHQEYICPEPCTKTCEKGHVCPDICGQECIPCRTKMEKKLPCGHVHITECSTDPTSINCSVRVEKTKLPCKHILTLPCHQDVERLDCTAIVDRLLQCGHTQIEKCSEHGKCSIIVCKDLPCGHIKSMECYQTEEADIVCTEMIRKILPCSHTKELECHVKPDKATCLKLVVKTRQPCGHIVKEKCSAESDCTEIVNKSLPCRHHKDVKCCEDVNEVLCQEQCERNLTCGHKCTGLCGDDCITKCNTIITRSDWPCGHKVTARCSDEPATCRVRCKKKLECGHDCKGSCGKCMQGRYHVPCAEKCNRTLVCGHKCTLSCVSPCLPCQAKCDNGCNHRKCDHPCGEVCPPCTKQCICKCPHHTCRMLCCEPCSRPPCNAPCLKKLAKCGHSCSGLCGEICPKLCSMCDKVALGKASFGSRDVKELRYVQLEDCGHVFEVTGLDRYMGLKQPETSNTLISLNRCPTCRTPLRHSRRYGNIIKQTKKHVMHVKKKLQVKKRQEEAEKPDMQRRMKNTLTLRNLEPLGIGKQLIGNWLRLHQVITVEREPAMTRLQLIRTLMELQTTLTKGTNETPSSGNSRRERLKPSIQIRHTRQSVWNGYINETLEQMKVLGNAILRDATSFSYQQAQDLHKETCRITYAVLLLIQLKTSTGREDIQPLENLLKALWRKGPLREEELERIRSILEDYYKTTGGEWPNNVQECPIQRQMTFSRDRWCRCPRRHTFMVEEDEASSDTIDCEQCLRSKAREIPRTAVQGSPSMDAGASNATTRDAIRRLAIEVPSCGMRRGPGEMPYKNKRSMKKFPMNPGTSRSLKRSPGKVGRPTQDDGIIGKSKDKRNETQSTHPSMKHKAITVVHEESKANRTKRRQNKDKGRRSKHVTGIHENKSSASSIDIARKGTQEIQGARAKDQESGNTTNRASPSKPDGALKTFSTTVQDRPTSRSHRASPGTSKSDSTSKHIGKPKGKMMASYRKATQSKSSKTTSPDVMVDHGHNETSRRRPRRREDEQIGGSSQKENQDDRQFDDVQQRSVTVERGSSNSCTRNRRRKGKGSEKK